MALVHSKQLPKYPILHHCNTSNSSNSSVNIKNLFATLHNFPHRQKTGTLKVCLFKPLLLTGRSMRTSIVWTDDHTLLQGIEFNWRGCDSSFV